MDDAKTGYVYRAVLTQAQLEAALAHLFTGPAHTIVHAPDRILGPQPLDTGMPATWVNGQVFNADAELRWREQAEDNYTVLILSENANLLASFDLEFEMTKYDLQAAAAVPNHGLLLWGTLRDMRAATQEGEAVWRETRIPRELRYPDSGGSKPPRLAYRHYVERESGVTRFTRLLSFVGGD
jgi:hypothetical protein